MKRAWSIVLGTLMLGIVLAAPSTPVGAAAGPSRRSAIIPASEARAGKGTGRPTAGGKLLRSQGYLVKNQAAYQQAKVEAAAKAGLTARTTSPGPQGPAPTPRTIRAWEGVSDRNVTPSDSTGAIGPTRYIELINARFAIYRRNASSLGSGQLQELAGAPPEHAAD